MVVSLIGSLASLHRGNTCNVRQAQDKEEGEEEEEEEEKRKTDSGSSLEKQMEVSPLSC